ncbi:hypothetical protein Mgra_00004827, partial [Meloidogyne graminicola]
FFVLFFILIIQLLNNFINCSNNGKQNGEACTKDVDCNTSMICCPKDGTKCFFRKVCCKPTCCYPTTISI